MEFDTYCFYCQREIVPKRTLVPVYAPQPTPPSPPPAITRRQKSTVGGGRRAGLVHGTGRVKPNGTLKRADSPPSQQSAPVPQPSVPVKHRTVIEQGPLSLYCSDECKAKGYAEASGCPSDYGSSPLLSSNTARSPSLQSQASTASTSSASSSSSASTSNYYYPDSNSSELPDHISPSLATYAKFHKFKKPIPPPFPVRVAAPLEDLPEFTGGVIMAGRRMAEICAKPQKKTQYGPYVSPQPEVRKPIPGWDDGTQDWRATMYGFAAPPKAGARTMSHNDIQGYKTHVAVTHRSRGVTSSMSSSVPFTIAPVQPTTSTSYSPETTALYEKFSESLNLRADARMAHSPPSPSERPKLERPLLGPGLEGKLLVPNVTMPVYTGSTQHLTSRRKSQASVTAPKRPAVELRSWSYDNVQTYPIMQVPPKKVKQIVQVEVDGQTVEKEIEVEVHEPRKKLFNFQPIVVRR